MDVPNHDTDFFGWTQQQSAALRSHPHDCGELDTEKLAEEIEDMGLEQIRKTPSFLVQMLVHLLKLHLEPNAPSAQHWFEAVLRFQADAVLAFSPGIKQRLDLEKIWRLAKKGATSKLGQYNVPAPDLVRFLWTQCWTSTSTQIARFRRLPRRSPRRSATVDESCRA